jgi:hypothetical protein
MVLMPGYNVEWFRQGDNPPAGPMALSPASETKRGASIFFLVLSMASPSPRRDLRPLVGGPEGRLGHAALLCAGPGLGSKPTEDRWMKG